MTEIIGFAHRGAPASKSEANTLAAFERALRLGAGGIETDIGVTADDVPVLRHAGLSWRSGRRMADLQRSDLPATVPSLQELYERCGTDFELSLDMAQPRAAEAVVAIAERVGAVDRLWLTYWRGPELRRWRRQWPQIKLVYPTIPVRLSAASRLLARLADDGVDVLNVHHRFCHQRLVDDAHRLGLRCFAWGIRSERALYRVIQAGVDGVYCDNTETMVRVLTPPTKTPHTTTVPTRARARQHGS